MTTVTKARLPKNTQQKQQTQLTQEPETEE